METTNASEWSNWSKNFWSVVYHFFSIWLVLCFDLGSKGAILATLIALMLFLWSISLTVRKSANRYFLLINLAGSAFWIITWLIPVC